MKKKMYLAVLAMCIALTATACGDSKTTDSSTQTEANKDSSAQDAGETADADASDEAEADGPARLVSVENVDKYVTIGEYKGLNLDNTVAEVTDDDVEAQVQSDLTDKAEEVKSGTVETGDIVTINFVGTKDGVAFDGGTANNYDLTIGQGGMIDGFEDGIIGMKKGETKDLNLTFPDDYQEESLAGQDVVFKVTLQSFKRVQELTDDWVTKNTDYKTIDEYRAGVRTQLEDTAKANAESTLKSTAWSTVLGNSEVKEYPQEDIDSAITELKTQTEAYAKQSDMELEEFVKSQGVSMDDFEEQCQQYAEYSVKQNLIVQGIMDAEGLTLEDDESKAIQDQLVATYGAADLAALISQYGASSVNASVGLMRVESFIVDNAVVEEKISNGDAAGINADAVTSGTDSTEVTTEDGTEDTTDDTTETADTQADTSIDDIGDAGDEEDPTVDVGADTADEADDTTAVQ